MTERVIDDELRAALLEEAREALDEALRLRDDWSSVPDTEVARRAMNTFRSFHNLKGAARLVGLPHIESLAHAAEEALRVIVGRGERPSPLIVDVWVDALHAMVGHADGTIPDADMIQLTREVAASISVGWKPDTRQEAPQPDAESEPGPPGVPAASEAESTGVDTATAFVEVAATRATDFVRVRTGHLDRLFSAVTEMLTLEGSWRSMLDEAERLRDGLEDRSRRGRSGESANLDDVVRNATALASRCSANLRELTELNRQLSDTVREARMLPLGSLVPAFRRIVEDTASQVGKRVRFESDVGEIAIDRRILDGLRDPMMHLLRNAVDHGIEAEARRLEVGKEPIGLVRVHATAAGSVVRLVIEDDGGGVEPEAIGRRAVSLGLATEAELSQLTDDELLSLVFLPSFTTVSSPTRTSGRGIGLDAVMTRVRSFGGNASISSKAGHGTRMVLDLPADVVQTPGLLARVGTTIVALPMSEITRVVRITAESVTAADGGFLATLADGGTVRLVSLATLIGETPEPASASFITVIARVGGRLVGLVVAEVERELDFVVRPLPWNLSRVKSVAGAVVLPEGGIALVFHLAVLLEGGVGQRGGPLVRHNVVPATRVVLVVDDCPTSRLLLRNTLSSSGYEVLLAEDGLEAWEVLERRPVDLVITDVQMPRLDGHELTRRIRKDPKTRSIPVIMVTSMSRPEDVQLGATAGADEYIVKGRFDHGQLIEAVGRLC